MQAKRPLLALLLALAESAAAPPPPSVAPPPLQKIERSARCMGTEFTIDAYGRDISLLEAASQAAFEEAQRLDDLLSNYQSGSELSKVNRDAAGQPVRVSPEFLEFLQTCMRYSRASEGSFDITVGALMKVWGFYKGSGRLPHRAEVREALSQVGYQFVELDPRHSTVYFAKPGLQLDPGGVGKGLAVDRMAEVLRKYGVDSALVSGGGSSIYAIGAPPDDSRGWYIRIREPRDESRTAAEVYLKDNSLSTSGNYEKFFWAEGRLYSHIMNPRTGFPAQGRLAVSVVSPRTLDSEIWAKPYFILGRNWTAQHKQKAFRVLMCEDNPGAKCEWLQ